MTEENKIDTDHLKLLKEIQADARRDIRKSMFQLIENNQISTGVISINHDNLLNANMLQMMIIINGQEFTFVEPMPDQLDKSYQIENFISATIANTIVPQIIGKIQAFHQATDPNFRK